MPDIRAPTGWAVACGPAGSRPGSGWSSRFDPECEHVAGYGGVSGERRWHGDIGLVPLYPELITQNLRSGDRVGHAILVSNWPF